MVVAKRDYHAFEPFRVNGNVGGYYRVCSKRFACAVVFGIPAAESGVIFCRFCGQGAYFGGGFDNRVGFRIRFGVAAVIVKRYDISVVPLRVNGDARGYGCRCGKYVACAVGFGVPVFELKTGSCRVGCRKRGRGRAVDYRRGSGVRFGVAFVLVKRKCKFKRICYKIIFYVVYYLYLYYIHSELKITFFQ